VSGWIRETPVKAPAGGLALTPEGIIAKEGFRRLDVQWDQVFGVALMPIEAPTKAFLLVPRKPPEPPWIEVSPADLPEDVSDLETLAVRIRARVQQSGYRDRGPQRPMLPPDQLMEKVLAREDVPGALEIPVGAGPGGWWRRGVDLLASGSAGGLLGLYGGALTGSAMLAVVIAGAGAAVGAALPMAFARNWRSLRGRSKRPRVLVLAPDGCVVGLPTGPEAFAWSDIGGFQEALDGRVRRLEVRRRDGSIAGSIDAAWFGAPLELITAVAQAYLDRQRR
jgi:hypothetical protein